MLIHSNKATKAFEELLPDNLTPIERDAVIRMAFGFYATGQDHCVTNLLLIVNSFSKYKSNSDKYEQTCAEEKAARQAMYDSMFSRPRPERFGK